MGSDSFRGDPASAMLEVLDPHQHSTFRDHYLDLPFDLSRMLFICTANTLDTIPAPLLDRMDVIQLSGYTHDEKLGIAKRYLVPKQLREHGLTKSRVALGDKALRLTIAEYTREAGVRNLERQIATLLPQGGDARRPGRDVEDQDRRGAGARVAGAAPLLERGPEANRRSRRRDRARLHRRRRRRPLHRGDRVPGPGQAPDHRPARRGDAGVGAGGPLVDALAREPGRAGARVVRRARHPHPRPGRRRAEGRPLRGDHDGDGDRLARPEPARSRRRSG